MCQHDLILCVFVCTVCMYVCMYCLCVCMYAMYVCMYVLFMCIYVCMYVRMYVCMCRGCCIRWCLELFWARPTRCLWWTCSREQRFPYIHTYIHDRTSEHYKNTTYNTIQPCVRHPQSWPPLSQENLCLTVSYIHTYIHTYFIHTYIHTCSRWQCDDFVLVLRTSGGGPYIHRFILHSLRLGGAGSITLLAATLIRCFKLFRVFVIVCMYVCLYANMT